MALYRYLKQQQHSDDKLPDPQGPLSIEISAIVSANEEVRRVVSKESVKQRGPYAKFTAEQRAAIGKSCYRPLLPKAVCQSQGKQLTHMEENLHIGNGEEVETRTRGCLSEETPGEEERSSVYLRRGARNAGQSIFECSMSEWCSCEHRYSHSLCRRDCQEAKTAISSHPMVGTSLFQSTSSES